MGWIKAVVLSLALAGAGLALAGQPEQAGRMPVTSKRMTLEQTVGPEVFQKAGLAKLTPEEQFLLADWIRDYGQQIAKYVEEAVRREAAGPKP
jgi:hypothetical protein